MIFVILGSQKFQFNRLLKAVDDFVGQGRITDEVFAQRGYSDYVPKNFLSEEFVGHAEFEEIMEKSDLVISHGGTGAVIGAVKKGKKVIAVPRLAKYGEHVDDHQVQLLTQFEEMNIIEVCHDLGCLDELIKKVRRKTYQSYVSNTENIIDSIEKYIRTEG